MVPSIDEIRMAPIAAARTSGRLDAFAETTLSASEIGALLRACSDKVGSDKGGSLGGGRARPWYSRGSKVQSPFAAWPPRVALPRSRGQKSAQPVTRFTPR